MGKHDDAIKFAERWLNIIKKADLDEATAQEISREAEENIYNYFNRKWMDYRKTITAEDDYTKTEWRGQGCCLYDVYGNEFIDCLGVFGALNLGWCHPEVVSAVQAQAGKTSMPGKEMLEPLKGALANLMAQVTPGDIQYSFFVNSGTETVEGALKLAILYTGKRNFISTIAGFHGKTLGSLSVMGKKDFRAGFQPFGGQTFYVPFGDADALEKQLEICETLGLEVAAFIAEPIQGEAGCVVPPDEYWPKVREICNHYGVLLIADEVQTGLGRTGKFWGVDHWQVTPDIMTSAKALGGGVMPVGAFMSNERIWKVLEEPNPFMHTNTTGGNPLACAAAIATIMVTLRDNLPEQAAEKGNYFMENLNVLVERYPRIYKNITGKGLLIGQHFNTPGIGYKIAAGLYKRRVLVSGALLNKDTMRFEPPLIITKEQINEVLNRLEDTIKEVDASL